VTGPAPTLNRVPRPRALLVGAGPEPERVSRTILAELAAPSPTHAVTKPQYARPGNKTDSH